MRPASASRVPARPRVGAYWNALTSPETANSCSSCAARSRGNVTGSGQPPANEITSGRPRNASTSAMPSPTSPRVRAAKSASHSRVSGVTAIARLYARIRVAPPPDPAHAAGVVWRHALVTNVQRTARNRTLLPWPRRLWLIDHGAALFFRRAGERDPAPARKPFPAIREHVLLPFAGSIADAD